MHIDVFTTSDHAEASAAFQSWLGDRGAPDFVALHLDTTADHGAIAARLAETRALHGATSCQGVMSQGADDANQALGAFCLWDAEGDFGTGLAALDDDPKAAGAAAAERALDAAGRLGEAPDLIWLSTAPGNEEAVLAGIESVVGTNVPILGGSAADNDISGAWRVFDRNGVEGAGVVVSVLFPSGPVSFAYHNGYAPTKQGGVVTHAQGRRIHTIDNAPAAEVYSRWTEGAVPTANGSARAILSDSTLTPLGRYFDSVGDVPYYLLAHPATALPDGAIELFADVAEGERLTLMAGSADTLTERAGKVARFATKTGGLQPDQVAGALMVYCGGCKLAVADRMGEVVSGLRDALPGAPFLGVFTFGEQGTLLDGSNRHGNLMISCIVFGKQSKDILQAYG